MMLAATNTVIHNNVVLQLSKHWTSVLLLSVQVFRPYAKFWLAPIVHFITVGGAGSEVNYFVTDLVVTLLSWHTVAIPEVLTRSNFVCVFLAEIPTKTCISMCSYILMNQRRAHRVTSALVHRQLL